MTGPIRRIRMNMIMEDGFTLVEMLIVSALIVIVIGVSLQAVVKGLTSYNKIEEAFDREKNFTNFASAISYYPNDAHDVLGVMQRSGLGADASGSTLRLTTGGKTIQYALSGTDLVRTETGVADPEVALSGIDTSAGKGITFAEQVNSGKKSLKVKAYFEGRNEPYIVYIAERNAGGLL